ncbi:MAG: DNA cytosine methyltransferase [Oceanicaulis sp.]
MSQSATEPLPKPTAIDLFSGCGGLTLGLKKAGYRVIGAVENDKLAAETFELNHPKTYVFKRDIRDLPLKTVTEKLGLEPGQLTLLAGCPPCQGFSTLRTRNGAVQIAEPMNDLVYEFVRFAEGLRPQAVMMENVPGLATDERIEEIKASLEAIGYQCDYKVFNAAEFGAPQRRRRMILIGLQGRKPEFAEPSKRRRTVKSVIGALPPAGKSGDPLHDYEVRRAHHVQQIIKSIPVDGGSRRDLPKALQLKCHKDFDGYRDIYGRMAWSKPSPTITGGCINPSKGRFLHPEHDRAITLREAAMLQGFPKNFKFDVSKGRYPTAQMIGNAFPPIFAQKHATALLAQLNARTANKDANSQ